MTLYAVGLRFRRRFIARAHSGCFEFFPLAGKGDTPAYVYGYYWSATTSYDTRYDAYYLGLLPQRFIGDDLRQRLVFRALCP